MKIMRKALTTLVGLTLSWSTLSAQDFREYKATYEALSPSDQKGFMGAIEKAQRLVREKRMFEALEQLSIADKIIPNHPTIRLLHASIDVHFREFADAEEIYKSLHEEAPKSIEILFNLGEMHFVQGEWEPAFKMFEKVISLSFTEQKSVLYYLAEFKSYICHRKLGNDQKAQEIAERYDYTTDSPIYYYIEIEKSLSEGNNEDANRLEQRVKRIFGAHPSALLPYLDSLEEAGYLIGENKEGK